MSSLPEPFSYMMGLGRMASKAPRSLHELRFTPKMDHGSRKRRIYSALLTNTHASY